MKSACISMMAACLIAGTVAEVKAEQGEQLWYPTSEPELGDTWPREMIGYRLIPWEKYPEHAKELPEFGVVPIKERPKDSRPLQGCGINFSYGGVNRSFCVVGTAQTEYAVYADTNADSSLQDEDAIPLTASRNFHVAEFRTTVTEELAGEESQYPVMLRFVVYPPGDSSRSNIRYAIQPWTYRRGVIRLEDRTVPFELRGSAGVYDAPSNAVWFDLDGDGKGGAHYENRKSDESFKIRDEHVNIGGTSYRFEVDRYGRHLALAPLEKRQPPRPSLEPGSAAPDFSATGINGTSHNLGQYQQDVVLLDFWYTTCAPCIKDAPKLAGLRDRYADDGLQIIGITPDNEAAVREFTKKFDHDWPQIQETFEDPIHKAYRVIAYPAKFLIDRNGKIICHSTGTGFWEECWSKAEKALRP